MTSERDLVERLQRGRKFHGGDTVLGRLFEDAATALAAKDEALKAAHKEIQRLRFGLDLISAADPDLQWVCPCCFWTPKPGPAQVPDPETVTRQAAVLRAEKAEAELREAHQENARLLTMNQEGQERLNKEVQRANDAEADLRAAGERVERLREALDWFLHGDHDARQDLASWDKPRSSGNGFYFPDRFIEEVIERFERVLSEEPPSSPATERTET